MVFACIWRCKLPLIHQLGHVLKPAYCAVPLAQWLVLRHYTAGDQRGAPWPISPAYPIASGSESNLVNMHRERCNKADLRVWGLGACIQQVEFMSCGADLSWLVVRQTSQQLNWFDLWCFWLINKYVRPCSWRGEPFSKFAVKIPQHCWLRLEVSLSKIVLAKAFVLLRRLLLYPISTTSYAVTKHVLLHSGQNLWLSHLAYLCLIWLYHTWCHVYDTCSECYAKIS